MKHALSHKLLYSVIFSLFFCVLILPLNESLWFNLNDLSRAGLAYSYLTKFLFGIGMTCLVWFALRFTERVKAKDVFYVSWLKYSLIYGSLLTVLLLFIFPGIWMWDEFFILEASRVYSVASWQHIFTQIHYIISLYIIPSSTGITIVQLFAVSTIVGYSIATIQRLFPLGKFWPLIWLPFLSFPALFSDFYTLRLHIYGYLLLLLVIKILALYTDKIGSTPQYVHFIGFVVIVTLLAFWRSEGVIYLATLPLIAYRLRVFNKKDVKTLIVGIVSVLIIMVGFLATKYTESPRYKITALINPLSVLIHEDLKGDQIEEAWSDIDTSLNLEVLKKYPSYIEIPANWIANKEPLLRDGFENNLDRYYRGAGYIIINNLDIFLKYRLKTFLATNGMENGMHGSYVGNFTPFSTTGCDYLNENQCEVLHNFDRSSKLNRSFNPQLREKVLNVLLINGDSPLLGLARGVVWNVLPIIIALILIAVHALWAKRYIWAMFTGILLIHATLVFGTAPANYFMYYFPVYLVGLVLMIIYPMYFMQLGQTPYRTKRKRVKRGDIHV